MAGAILSALRCCFPWQAQYFLQSGAGSRGRRSTFDYLARVGRRGPPSAGGLPAWQGGGLFAWQAEYFLHPDAVSRGRRSALCTPMRFRVAGAVVCITLRRLAAVGRGGAAVFLRGRRNTFCIP